VALQNWNLTLPGFGDVDALAKDRKSVGKFQRDVEPINRTPQDQSIRERMIEQRETTH